jgi:hypothetical protein
MNRNINRFDPKSPWLNRTVRMGPGVAQSLVVSTKAGSTAVTLQGGTRRGPEFTYIRY